MNETALTMELEVQIANSDKNGFDTIELTLDPTQTLCDIKSNLIKLDKLNEDEQQQHVLYHLNSAIIFNDATMTINECLTNLKLTETDKLSLHLAQMYSSNHTQNDNEQSTTNNGDDIIKNLHSEIDQYRTTISNLELNYQIHACTEN